MAEISVFIANNHPNNLTVNETDPVTLQCTAVGRPTPAMRIVKNGQRVADRPRGQVSPEDTATLVHRVSRAECSEAGRTDYPGVNCWTTTTRLDTRRTSPFWSTVSPPFLDLWFCAAIVRNV